MSGAQNNPPAALDLLVLLPLDGVLRVGRRRSPPIRRGFLFVQSVRLQFEPMTKSVPRLYVVASWIWSGIFEFGQDLR